MRISDWSSDVCSSDLELTAIHARHGYAILLDGHSIAAEVPRFFEGRLPDLNLGSNDGRSCAPELGKFAYGILSASDRFSHIYNGRFKGDRKSTRLNSSH